MKKNLSIYTLIALFAGIIAGLFGKEYVGQLSFIGTIYINILKFLIAPVVFTSIASTIYASQNRKDKLYVQNER